VICTPKFAEKLLYREILYPPNNLSITFVDARICHRSHIRRCRHIQHCYHNRLPMKHGAVDGVVELAVEAKILGKVGWRVARMKKDALLC
jgi:hypothetical protein